MSNSLPAEPRVTMVGVPNLGLQDGIVFLVVGFTLLLALRPVVLHTLLPAISRYCLKIGRIRWAMALHRRERPSQTTTCSGCDCK